ncbi:hypothetical protein PIB30_096481 [Stylosanthes scabra]|uniref:Uncharacterized protein n=1 Tax=Stylosanthes scabra TaxID=79078 RepID=A0ABU6WU99_9FABA|nr:hypothetical protein [Stylosanthes scabra]
MKTLQVFKASPSSLGSQNLLPSSSTSLPLTFFDILWLRLPPVQRVFFYEFPHQPSLFYDAILPKLKHSLSLSLSYYFPLAGTLSWPHHSNKPIITYNLGDTLSLTVAESDADFNHLSGSDFSEASKLHHLVPELIISDDQATVMALQVTFFPNHGFSIGVTSHHAVLDGKTSTSFIKSWAYLCNKLGDSSSSSPCDLPPELSPFFDREIVKDPKGLEAKYLSDWLKEGGSNNRSLKVWNLQVPQDSVRGLFQLSRSNIEKLKNFVASKGSSNLHLSSFVVSLAYAWVCKVKAEQTKSKKVGMAINVDCRDRLDPPLPPTYFGNCIGGKFAFAETRKFLDEDDGGVVAAVESLSSVLEALKDGVLNEAEIWSSMLHDGLHSDEDVKMIGAAGTPRFEVYGSDFGWGRPKKVEMVSIDRTGAISLSDSRDGDGIQLGFVSSKASMESFASIFAKGLLL